MNPSHPRRRSSAPAKTTEQKIKTISVADTQDNETDQSPNDTDYKLPLAQQPYYHGVLPRQEIQRLLKNHGDFIARMTKKDDDVTFVISVNWYGEYMHFKLICDDEQKWKIEKKRFNTIPELIQFYYRSSTPLTKRTGVVLLNPRKHEKWELDNDQIHLKNKLGSGAFGEVFKGEIDIEGTKTEVAVKLCHESMQPDKKKKFVEEAHFMRKFDHPNIVKLYGVAAAREPIMIVMEFINGGGLDNFLKDNAGRLSTRLKTKFTVMAARGMEYLESNQCIHRDLAARNCLIDEQKILKISDFGLSRTGNEYKVQSTDVKIPVRWTAPEALTTRVFTLKSDVWSFGILVWEIFSEGSIPYPDVPENIDVLRTLRAGKRLSAPPNTPPEVNDVMQKCWQKDPSARPTFQMIVAEIEAIYFSLEGQLQGTRRAKSFDGVGQAKSIPTLQGGGQEDRRKSKDIRRKS